MEGGIDRVNINKKAIIILGVIFLFIIIVLSITVGYYKEKQHKEDDMNRFNKQKAELSSEFVQIDGDTKKALEFIHAHLPYEPNFLDIDQKIDISASGEEIALYYLEQSLLSNDTDTWFSFFSSAAIEKMMGQIDEATLDGRLKEISKVMDKLSRGGRLKSISSYDSQDIIYAVFHYSDDITVDVPIDFMKIEDNDILIDTDPLWIIEQIKHEID